MTSSRSACVYVIAALSSFSSALSQNLCEVHAPASPITKSNGLQEINSDHRSTSFDGRLGIATVAPVRCGATSSTPQELPQCLNERDQTLLARQFVDAKLATWRNRLNLEDWHISIVMARRGDLKPKTRGRIRWDKDKKSAVIWVMDPSDYHVPLREMLDDMEFTIVHELVHLELASLPRSEASRRTEEHAVNRLAAALLALTRQQ
jgi:hypothetical protein